MKHGLIAYGGGGGTVFDPMFVGIGIGLGISFVIVLAGMVIMTAAYIIYSFGACVYGRLR